MPLIKLKKANAPAIELDTHPSWDILAANIANLFSISLENVSVNFIDQDKDVVSITNDLELERLCKHFDRSSGEIKFVVQDLEAPDPLLSNADELRVFCWVLNVSDNPFAVDIEKSKTVDHLKEMIKKKKEHAFGAIDPDTLELWKVGESSLCGSMTSDFREAIPSTEIGMKLRHVQSPQVIPGCVKLDALDELSEHFSSAPRKHLHIIVQVPRTPSLKRAHSPSAQADGEAKKKYATSRPLARRWTVNGAITVDEASGRYYVDPGTHDVTSLCLDAVSRGTNLLLVGAPASGKSTRLIWLQQKLEAMGYWALYIPFETLLYRGSTKDFWESFGKVIDLAVARCGRGLPKGPTTPISSRPEFIYYFSKGAWDGNVVLLLDDLSLYQSEDDVRDDCLIAFRALKHARGDHAFQCLIAAGTLGTAYLTPLRGSPFRAYTQFPYFTIDETRKLFREFAEDLGFSIDDAIIEDVWAKSNGHPGMVCLCGRAIYRNMQTLICPQSRAISYYRWQRFPAERLYDEILLYDAFHSMIQSLSRAEASSSVDLLRSQFAGFLGDVELTDEEAKKDADALTSKGVLFKLDPPTPRYRMTSPLVDGLIRNQLIPAKFPDAPLSPPPLQHTGDVVDVLGILIESLKFFDKALILMASHVSCKKSKVKIHGSHRDVPRESVYDTELLRILANWLPKHGWSVVGQWHSEDDSKRHKYSDIALKKDSLTIVLELLATEEPSSESRIQKTPEHAALLSANDAWVVHFTCQEDYHPIWQSDMELSKGINVVHFAHDLGFTNVVMSARWKDCAGEIQQEVGKSLLLSD